MATQEQAKQGTQGTESTATRTVNCRYVATLQTWVTVVRYDHEQYYIARHPERLDIVGLGLTAEEACNDLAVAILCRDMQPE